MLAIWELSPNQPTSYLPTPWALHAFHENSNTPDLALAFDEKMENVLNVSGLKQLNSFHRVLEIGSKGIHSRFLYFISTFYRCFDTSLHSYEHEVHLSFSYGTRSQSSVCLFHPHNRTHTFYTPAHFTNSFFTVVKSTLANFCIPADALYPFGLSSLRSTILFIPSFIDSWSLCFLTHVSSRHIPTWADFLHFAYKFSSNIFAYKFEVSFWFYLQLLLIFWTSHFLLPFLPPAFGLWLWGRNCPLSKSWINMRWIHSSLFLLKVTDIASWWSSSFGLKYHTSASVFQTISHANGLLFSPFPVTAPLILRLVSYIPSKLHGTSNFAFLSPLSHSSKWLEFPPTLLSSFTCFQRPPFPLVFFINWSLIFYVRLNRSLVFE